MFSQTEDQLFLSKVAQLAASHLDCSEYSSSSLAEELSVSRFQLHRRLKSLVGLSFSQMMMMLRLWKSIFLLRKNAGNVSEVAYMVGFSSPSYFIKCYSKVFRVSPGETRKTRRFPKKPGVHFQKIIENPTVRQVLLKNDFEIEPLIEKNSFLKRKGILLFATMGFVLLATFLINSFNLSETKTVTYLNEKGITQESNIVLPEFRKRITIFPFRNKGPTNPELNWLGTGLSVGFAEDMGQNAYLITQRKPAESLSEMGAKARSEKQDYFITGHYFFDSITYQIELDIYDPVQVKPIYEFSLTGAGLFDLIDSAVTIILPRLGISESQIKYSIDLPLSEYMTNNLEAFRKYSEAYLSPILNFDFDPRIMEDALIMDSTFALAGFHSADFYNNWLINDALVRKCFKVAMSNRSRLNKAYQLQILALYHQIHKEPENAIKLLEIQSEFVEPTADNLQRLAKLYIVTYQFDKAVEIQKRLIQEFGTVKYECDLVFYLILAGKMEEATIATDLLLLKYPKNLDVMEQYMRLLLAKGDFEEANKVRKELMLLEPENKVVLSLLDSLFIYNDLEQYANLNDFVGTYQIPEAGMKARITIVNGNLRFAYENQYGSFYYQYKPDHFITSTYRKESHKKIFVRNEKGKIIKIINNEYQKDSSYYKYDIWKIDSLMLQGFDYFSKSQSIEARDKFREAVIENPEHIYLMSYLNHLEFITGSDFQPQVYERFAGEWNLINTINPVPENRNRTLKFGIVKNELIYYSPCCNTEYKVIPISSHEAKLHMYDWSDNVIFKIVERKDTRLLKVFRFNDEIKDYQKKGTYLKVSY